MIVASIIIVYLLIGFLVDMAAMYHDYKETYYYEKHDIQGYLEYSVDKDDCFSLFMIAIFWPLALLIVVVSAGIQSLVKVILTYIDSLLNVDKEKENK